MEAVMDDATIRAACEALGLVLDEGCLIAGPFIPDGTSRVYDPVTSRVLGEGKTNEEAWKNAANQLYGRIGR
jgi:hypothetical protein